MSEKLLVMHNHIYMHGWMVLMPLNANGRIFLLKHGFSGATPVSSDTTALTNLIFKLNSKLLVNSINC